MAGTNRQLNWTDVSLGATALTGITNISFDQGGKIQTLSADDDRFTTLAVQVMSQPTVKVDSVDPASIMGIASGAVGDFTATHKDAKGVTGGDILYVLAGAVAETATTAGAHQAFGTASLSLISVSNDGQTNPLSFTRA